MSCVTATTTSSSASSSSSSSSSSNGSSMTSVLPSSDLNNQKLNNLNKTISLIRNIKEERQDQQKSTIESIVDSINSAVNKNRSETIVVNKRKPTLKKSHQQFATEETPIVQQLGMNGGDDMDVDDEHIVDAEEELEEGKVDNL